jgi:hypothetical protein
MPEPTGTTGDTTPPDLDALHDALKFCTALPWCGQGREVDDGFSMWPILGGGVPGSAGEHLVATVGEFCNRQAEADTALIVAAVNALPALLARVAELTAENERLRDIIQPNEPDRCCANRHPDAWTGEVCLFCPDRLRRAFNA